MRQLLIILLTIFILFSYKTFLYNEPKPQKIENMIPPVILVAESLEGDVTIADVNSFVTLPCSWYMAKTISNTYNPGDTIVFLDNRKSF